MHLLDLEHIWKSELEEWEKREHTIIFPVTAYQWNR
jgi:hypothetical protein